MTAIKKTLTDGQASETIKHLGTQLQNIEQIELHLAKARKLITDGGKAQKSDKLKKITAHLDKLEAHARANRDRLTDNGKSQSFTFPDGSRYAWNRSHAVSCEDPLAAIELIERMIAEEEAKGKKADQDKIGRLRSFIRIPPPELNRDLMIEKENHDLANSIVGVAVVTSETWTAEPHEVDCSTKNKSIRKLVQRRVGDVDYEDDEDDTPENED